MSHENNDVGMNYWFQYWSVPHCHNLSEDRRAKNEVIFYKNRLQSNQGNCMYTDRCNRNY
jgi:hypothetical protein